VANGLYRSRIALFSLQIFLVLAVGTVMAQNSASEQCNVAIVSRWLDHNQPACNLKVPTATAAQGRVFEQNQSGITSTLVIGPEYSDKSALKSLGRAARAGNAAAQVNLAVMYLNGWGTPANYPLALHWLQAAANQGFARAYFDLGILFLEGKGVPQDYAEAFRWFQKAAYGNDTDAETNLGYLYDQGLGCPRDETLAFSWYRKAAEAGNPLGENNLADMYLRGYGVSQDYAQAFRLFQKAAIQGHTGARIKLGYMYAEGLGTQKDLETAYAWVLSASRAGDVRGKDLLASLEGLLTPEQISEAQSLANELRGREAAQPRSKNQTQDPSTPVSRAGENAREPSSAQD
jgi:hypothetical protein